MIWPFPCAERFYFRAEEDDAGFKRFEDVIIAPAFVVGHYIRHDHGSELPLPALLGLRADEFGNFGHIPADFVLNDFAQGNVRHTEAAGALNERTAPSRRCRS